MHEYSYTACLDLEWLQFNMASLEVPDTAWLVSFRERACRFSVPMDRV